MNELSSEDQRWLDAAVGYAAPFASTTADNPTVGALVVNPHAQTLVARAVTARGGRPHAEAEAIAKAGFEAAGCTLYVTLEPCHHWGRTPPCVDAIIRAGIMRVVIGTTDPDPRTAGGSIAQLQSAGIETVLAKHAGSRNLHAGHILRHTSNRPFVTAVVTVSADDKLVPAGGRDTVARELIETLRTRADAVLVGAATARADDTTLAVGLPGLASRTPLRVVLAGASGVDRKLNLIGGFSGHRTAIIAETATAVDAPVSVETIRIAGKSGRPDLSAALESLAARNVQSLLVEPGQRLAAALLEADLVDRFVVISNPQSLGPAGVAASADGPSSDVIEVAGLVEARRQLLGESALTVYERPQQPD